MVSCSWKVVTTHYLSYPSLFGGLKGPPFFYRSWVIRIAPHGASRITLGVFKKKGPLGPLIPKFWLKTIRTWKLTCYLWYGTRSETKKVISTEKLKSISSDQVFIDRREPWLISIEIWTDLKTLLKAYHGQWFPVPHEFHLSRISCNLKWYQWGSVSIGDNDRCLACWEGLKASWAGLSPNWEGLEANP